MGDLGLLDKPPWLRDTSRLLPFERFQNGSDTASTGYIMTAEGKLRVSGGGDQPEYDPTHFGLGPMPTWPVRSPQGNRDWLDRTADFFAGYGDAMTANLTKYYRRDLLGYDATDYDSGLYLSGQVTGTVASTSMAFINPCGSSAVLTTGSRVMNGLKKR